MGKGAAVITLLAVVGALSVLLAGGEAGGSNDASLGLDGQGAVGRGQGGAVVLLDWWKSTTMLAADKGGGETGSKTAGGPTEASDDAKVGKGSRGRDASPEEKMAPPPATVPVTDEDVRKVTKYYDDMTARSSDPADYDDDEKISEGELAGRLGRAIDAHEKCRRHWPHLEKLEAAQEIRVHDARNNLEVANRGMERARRELTDAENLVMAARSEHQTYEKQRVAFQRFKDAHDRSMSLAKDRKEAVELYSKREEAEESELREHRAHAVRLEAASAALEARKAELAQLEAHDQQRLSDLTASEALAQHKEPQLKIATGQQLAELPASGSREWHQEDGIVIPSDTSASLKAVKGDGGARSLQGRIQALEADSKLLSSQEVVAFAALPQDEASLLALKAQAARDRRRGDIAGSREAVLAARLRRDEKHGAASKTVVLDEDKLKLAQVDVAIHAGRQGKERKQIAALELDERRGPEISRELEGKRREVEVLKGELLRTESLQAAEGGEASSGSTQGRLMQLSEVPVKAKHAPRSRADLRADLRRKDAELQAIRDKMLKVRSALKPEEDMVAVDREKLKSRTHELARATRLAGSEGATMGDREYNHKIRDLREERKRADGLLAKAERMLNVAREDTDHASRSKAAALEELQYATAKLRKYQHLRKLSQECQMRAWSTIRKLTHRARERKMLDVMEQQHGSEALRGVLAQV